MRRFFLDRFGRPSVLVMVALLGPLSPVVAASDNGAALWPAETNTTKPWAYWHWLGSAVDETNLSRELHRYAAAGLGGVHVIPIYGAKGWEDRYIPYLSPRWMQMLGYTVSEAHRLGLGVDMTTGTGWNFGGPNITPELSCLRFIRSVVPVAAGQKPAPIGSRADVLAVIAEAAAGEAVDVAGRLAPNGTIDWVAPGAGWNLEIVRVGTGQPEVERAAPGGEGPLLNPFYRAAMDDYLQRFDAAFASTPGPRPRAMYNDSYEYHGAAWSPDLYDQFARRRGYRIEAHLAELFGPANSDSARRVRADYRETLSDLLLDSMTVPWVDWSHRHGFITRDQAHGSPGNLLDLYAAADIPETEMFYKDRDILVSKFASSAGHVAGHPLVASETGTWLAEHFTETLGGLKRNVDDLLLAGVNHVFYHATCYSPDEAGWPGWLFYASTEMNPRNSIWHDVPALNAYVARCQSLLQAGHSDNDILLYWPIHDLWYDEQPLVVGLGVHHREWLDGQPLGPLARRLWSKGWLFDYLSDRQLATAHVQEGRIVVPGGGYRTILVPACTQIPLPTLQALLALARAGATVIFDGGVPHDVPGFAQLDERRRELGDLLRGAGLPGTPSASLTRVTLGRGNLFVGPAESGLVAAGIHREMLCDSGVGVVRRQVEGAPCYFLVNKGAAVFTGWAPLAVDGAAAALLDPMTGAAGLAASRRRDGYLEVFLQLNPGESVFVRVLPAPRPGLAPYAYWHADAPPSRLGGEWHVRFVAGGPDLPPPFTTMTLGSWTTMDGGSTQRFAGTAVYTLRFNAPAGGGDFLLSLGGVAQSARVRFNGRDCGTLIAAPFQVVLHGMLPSGNVLEVEVTSVAANRIRDLDRRGVLWKNFHDINFVDLDYKPFDASHWPLHEAGLLGPVTLSRATAEWPR